MNRPVRAIGHDSRSSSQLGKGSSIQRGSRWSKSVDQSVTGGRLLIASFLDDVDGEFGAVGLGEPRLGLERGRHGAVAKLPRIAPLVELEELRRQRKTARMTLAALAVDPHSQGLRCNHPADLPVRAL